jgi:hypothetical protein
MNPYMLSVLMKARQQQMLDEARRYRMAAQAGRQRGRPVRRSAKWVVAAGRHAVALMRREAEAVAASGAGDRGPRLGDYPAGAHVHRPVQQVGDC